MKKYVMFALLCVTFALSGGCSVVQSLNTTRLEQTAPNEVKVTTLTAGLLTIASTQRLMSLRGDNLLNCTLESTYRGQAHGVICRDVVRGFVVTVQTLGTVAARVTPNPSSANFITFELDKTARGLE